MSTLNKTNRRDFLKITSLTGGGLILGISWFGSEAAPVVLRNAAVAGDLNFNSYYQLQPMEQLLFCLPILNWSKCNDILPDDSC
jgi:hypothetical protein